MNTQHVSLAVLGLSLVAAAIVFRWGGEERRQPAEFVTADLAVLERLGGQLDSLGKDVKSNRNDLLVALGEQRRMAVDLASLEGRVEAITRRTEDERADPADAAATNGVPVGAEDRREFAALLTKVLRVGSGADASDEEQQKFWEWTRSTSLVSDRVAELEAVIEKNPADLAARLDLADAYVAKLLTVPAGPERGIWGMRAEAQWQEVVRQDPASWDAQFALAYNYGKYPDFLDKTEDAIRGFEAAREIQERGASEGRHVETYLELARLYVKRGDKERARAALQQGLARHPQDARILAALDRLDS